MLLDKRSAFYTTHSDTYQSLESDAIPWDVVTLEVIEILLAVKFVVTSEASEGIFHLLLAGHVIPFLAALETFVCLEVRPYVLYAEVVLLPIPKEFG